MSKKNLTERQTETDLSYKQNNLKTLYDRCEEGLDHHNLVACNRPDTFSSSTAISNCPSLWFNVDSITTDKDSYH